MQPCIHAMLHRYSFLPEEEREQRMGQQHSGKIYYQIHIALVHVFTACFVCSLQGPLRSRPTKNASKNDTKRKRFLLFGYRYTSGRSEWRVKENAFPSFH